MPPNTVKVARPTKWGNPYVIGKTIAECTGYHCFAMIETAEDAVEEYREDLFDTDALIEWCGFVHRNIEQLRGKNLACFCPLDQPCHADILLELANK
ncbi:MAG: DUF4326 domain-containing protein [Geminicoccaceae bacterium]